MRRGLALLALCVLVLTAGCSALGPGEVSEADLAENVDHDWNTTANATLTVERDRYRAVYRVTGRETIDLYHPRRLDNRDPIDPIGAAFRYPNGTVVNITTDDVERADGATVVTLPAENGSLAFAAPRTGKRLAVPTNVPGSYEVVLPDGGRVQYPLLGRVVPGGYDRSVASDGRVHLRWADPRGDRVVVEYYLARDLLLLGGIVAVAGAALLGGAAYFLLVLRRLRRRRDEVALDVETGDGQS